MIWEAVGVVHMNSDRGLAAEALARVFRTYTSRPVYSYGDTKSAVLDMAEKAGKDCCSVPVPCIS